MNVKKVLVIEGCVNLLIMLLKLLVGIATNSTAILADAFHSLTDMANNIIAWFAVKKSEQSADDDHQYGHQKFVPLAVFFLATLLCVVALEVIIEALRRFGQPVQQSEIGIAILVSVLIVNIVLSVWQSYWAKTLNSNLLRADASHTFSDVLTSIAVIVGWQLAVLGWYWLDTVFAIIIAVIIFVLAYKLFVQSIPILVDKSVLDQALIAKRIAQLAQVKRVKMVRTRNDGEQYFADLTITVNASLGLPDSHNLADQIESLLQDEFEISDTVVHIEPDH